MRRYARPLLAFVSTIHVVACSTPRPEPAEDGGIIGGCKLPYVGDPNAEMIVDVVALGPNGKLVPIEDGSDITLMFPDQGGRVLFVGVRARNVNPCGVRLLGALRDPVSKQVRPESRIINLLVTEDGYGQSDPTDVSTFANIPCCPNHWSDQDVMDAPYELTVSLTDKDDRQVTKVFQVTPRCNQPGQISGCRCICDSEYVLGMMCADLLDAGHEDAATVPSDAAGD